MRAVFAGCAALLIGIGAAQAQSPCTGAGVTPVALTPTMPTNFLPTTGQPGADCLAWQEFIYLNWQADPNNPGQPNPNAPASSFGTPGDTTPTVWESYLEASQVFNPPPAVRFAWNSRRPAVKSLTRRSKADGIAIQIQLGPNDIVEASCSGPCWLTNQRGALTYYEIKMNEDEYQFITTNDLTTYAGQLACATQAGTGGKGGFNLPGNYNGDTDCTGAPQTYGQGIGAIEIKAAWTPLPADGSLNYRYKIANAQITDPYGNVTQATVGLVGLHIIHKFPNAAQFVWATFEQIDNSPDDNNGGTPTWPQLPTNRNQQQSPGYTFFNPNCTPGSDPVYQCQRNFQPSQPCPQGVSSNCQPYSAPMQVTRITPVETTANGVTGYVWGLLPANSVFNYYRLIDVQWPNQPSMVAPGSTTPLSRGDIQPPDTTRIVANTTLETFVQNSASCMDCHQYAPIAQPSSRTAQRKLLIVPQRAAARATAPAVSTGAPYASDYSFTFTAETTR
jgi:hypothetical protein